jgi:hypothetical protein
LDVASNFKLDDYRDKLIVGWRYNFPTMHKFTYRLATKSARKVSAAAPYGSRCFSE